MSSVFESFTTRTFVHHYDLKDAWVLFSEGIEKQTISSRQFSHDTIAELQMKNAKNPPPSYPPVANDNNDNDDDDSGAGCTLWM